jgi:hypothetical protein
VPEIGYLGVDLGTLAAVAPYAQLAGGLEWGRLSAVASATATGSVIGELDGSSAGAQMSLLMGGVSGCAGVLAIEHRHHWALHPAPV